MADDIRDVDGEVLRIPVQFSSDITDKIFLYKNIISAKGTSKTLVEYEDDKPRKFNIEFLNCDKEDEYDLLEFWHDRKGNFGSWWFILEEVSFYLKNEILPTDIAFSVTANLFLDFFVDKYFVCFRFRNGDILVRKINSVTENLDGSYNLNTLHQFDIGIQASDIFGIYQIIKCKFDAESLKLRFSSSEVSETDIEILELNQEYP